MTGFVFSQTFFLRHLQRVKCYCCQQTDCSDFATHHAQDAATELCPHCHRHFFGPRCLELHIIHSPCGQRVHPLTFDNVCAQVRCCGHCGRTFKKFQDYLSHLCGYQSCHNCKATVDVWDHKCFIQPIPNRRGPKRKHPSSTAQPEPEEEEEQAVVKIFFDCECMQEGGEAHRVNLVCAETSLDDQRYQFPSMHEFMVWVWNLKVTDRRRRPFVLIAHNFQRYDGYLLLEELYQQAVVPSQIVNGAKVLSVAIPGDIKFIDSLNFFPMALASFPKTFGLQEEAKGFFPHFFNLPTLQQYVGAMPDPKYYDPDGMTPARRAEFEQWYAEQVASHRVFNLQTELLKYCQSDVRILNQACTLFEREFRGICGFDPFEQCITIASACNVAYRRHWMRPRTLAIKPLHGWHPQIRQSRVALEWLYHLERILPTPTDGEPRLHTVVTEGKCCSGSGNVATTPMVTIRAPGSCTNSTGVSTTGAPNVFPSGTNAMPNSMGPRPTNCTRARSNEPIVLVKADTSSWKNGNANGKPKRERIPSCANGPRACNW